MLLGDVSKSPISDTLGSRAIASFFVVVIDFVLVVHRNVVGGMVDQTDVPTVVVTKETQVRVPETVQERRGT
jgi:hypothetical protein